MGAVPDLDALDKLLAAGTPGPWESDGFIVSAPHAWGLDEGGFVAGMIGTPGGTRVAEDAALIVAAVNSLPALIARVRLLEAAAQRYLDYTGEHHWRCEHRTAAVGWKEGEPPVIQCVCGHDALRAALDAQPPNPDRLTTEAAMIAGLIEDAEREGDATPREPQG
jgi:hypothetical protein